jgi:DNA-binding transcriptional regulator YdaS (Cro superfamily)
MSKLKQWLDEKNGRRLELAKVLAVPQSFVTKMASGERPIPIHHMAAIESFTAGAVTRRDMRPTDFHRIWPELAQQPA